MDPGNYFIKNVVLPLKRIFPFVRPYWKTYLILAVFIFINILSTFLMTWFLQHVTDAAINKDFILLQRIMLWGLFIFVLVCIMTFFNSYVESAAIQKVKRDLKVALFEHALRLPPNQFMSYHSGDLLSRFTHDIHSASGLIGSNLLDLIRLPLTFIAVFFYLLYVNWQLALATLSVAPFVLLSGFFFSRLTRNNSKVYQENLSKMNSFLNDFTAGYPVVRTFSLERLMLRKFTGYADQQLSLEMKEAKLSGGMGTGSSLAGLMAYFVNLGLGSTMVANGSLSVGSLLAFISLMNYLVYPFTGFASSWMSFQRSAASFERIWEILGSAPDIHELPRSSRTSLSSLSIDLKNVSFTYDGEIPVLDNLNFSIPAGKTVAIVGPSGAGKSTLFKLLLGLLPPTSGEILINGQHMKQYSVSELRNFMAYVPQDTYLFAGTVRENLWHGDPEASEIDMIKATKEANIHEFIIQLPEGYDSSIGERGVRLSGGQKQRISIARAILRNAPLLLLDEATSSLDHENEISIQESLQKLMKHRTTVVIAHRLSTIQQADWIIVMDKGKVVAQGDHQTLIRQDNLYSRMLRLPLRHLDGA